MLDLSNLEILIIVVPVTIHLVIVMYFVVPIARTEGWYQGLALIIYSCFCIFLPQCFIDSLYDGLYKKYCEIKATEIRPKTPDSCTVHEHDVIRHEVPVSELKG